MVTFIREGKSPYKLMFKCPSCENTEDLVKIRLDLMEPPVYAIWCKVCGFMWNNASVIQSDKGID